MKSGRTPPSTRTLEKVARATGTRLRIHFDSIQVNVVPVGRHPQRYRTLQSGTTEPARVRFVATAGVRPAEFGQRALARWCRREIMGIETPVEEVVRDRRTRQDQAAERRAAAPEEETA